jgi:fatty acid desaturase
MHQFKRDPNHLLAYCIKTVIVFAALDATLALTLRRFGASSPTLGFAFAPKDLWLPALALLLCGLPSSLMHNCAHGNVGGQRLNKLVGEICGTIMLYGFGGFRLGHLFHHKYPDNPKYDPHPPRGLSFPEFLVIKATLVVVETAYLEAFGRSPTTEANLRWQTGLFRAGVVLKVLFWALLLGPKVFVLLYLPLYVGNIFVFAHINYATHVERADGQTEIINLHEGLYYRLVNLVSFGGYYHKSHHLRPKAFDPSKVALSSALAKPLLTFRMAPSPARETAPAAALDWADSRTS